MIPPGVFEQWADATWATDPESTKHNPPMLRAPNGVLEDVNNYFAAGKPLYDPGKIAVPTFLIHAEWDADLPSYQAIFHQVDQRALPPLCRVERRNAYGDAREEPHAVLPRDFEFFE
jgi:hypothetical protein